MIQLTDEEMESIFEVSHRDNGRKEIFREIAKAQLKRVVDDMDKYIVGIDSDGLKMKATPDCALKWWQALLEEVE